MKIQPQNYSVSNNSNHSTKPHAASGSLSLNPLSYKVSISDDGLKKCSDFKTKQQNDKQNFPENIIEIPRNSTIDITGETLNAFHEKLLKLNSQGGGERGNADVLSQNCLSVYSEMYDSIKKAYAEGTREIWIPDSEAGKGYRKATEDEEIAALDDAFDFYSYVIDGYINYGIEGGRMAQAAVDRLYAEINKQQKLAESVQRKEEGKKETQRIYERLLKSRYQFKDMYDDYSENLSLLVNKLIPN